MKSCISPQGRVFQRAMTSPAENFLVLLLKPVIFVFNELLKVKFFFVLFFNSNFLFYKDEFIHPFSATAGGGVAGPTKIRLWAKVGWGTTYRKAC